MLILLLFNSLSQIAELFFSREVLFSIFVSFTVFESLLLSNKLFFKTQIKSNLLQLTSSILIGAVATSLAVSLYFILIERSYVFHTELILFNAIYTLSALLFQFIIIGLNYQNQHQKLIIEQEQELRESLELKINSFRYQVNPAFLYTNLECILKLLPKRKRDAELIIQKTASMYRHILNKKHLDLIPIQDELNCIDDLINLRKHSHSENIEYSVNSQVYKENAFLIPNCLFRLIENIIQNSLFTKDKFIINIDNTEKLLYIRTTKRLCLFSEDKLTETAKIINNSLLHYSDKPLEFSVGNKEITACIPLIYIKEEE